MRADRLCVVLAGVSLLAAAARADEGMWTFDDPPLAQLEQRYGFQATRAWLDHLRLSSVRFMDGGSGSFVSPEGLMITNHHVGFGCIQNISAAGHDFVKEGFAAASRQEERPCPGYEVNVLVGSSDVSGRVLGAAKAEMTAAQAREARKAAIAAIENECSTRTAQRCDVVRLYQGAEYRLYEYKKYTDVRLVFAPEQQTAFFGGDPDNFTFPRHDLDICLMRAYENGRPAKPAAYLRWSRQGVSEGDLVFVSGNPGSTSRLETMARLELLRDQVLPLRIEQGHRRLQALRDFAAGGPEQRRRSLELIFGVENALKAFGGYLAALQDTRAMAHKAEAERALRDKVAASPALAASASEAWSAVAAIQQKLAPRVAEVRLASFGGSRLLEIAGLLVQYVSETRKPNAQRYEEFVDANLDSLRNDLFSPAPIYDDLELALLRSNLQFALDKLGPDHPFVKAALEGRSPAEAARAALAATRLGEPAVRKALVDGGPNAIAESKDSMIVLARRLDPAVREARRFVEDEIDAPTTRAMEKIAQARWTVYGRTLPPDATFTLRLAFGAVKGFPAEGTIVAPFTTFYGLYDRSLSHGGKPPWNLAARWERGGGQLALGTALNFVATADIIGGNSGSPVVDRAGEFVGIIFDGNIESLAWNFYYDDERARSVAVDARGILEALRAVYGAQGLAAELAGN